jgi:hypothetical protein
MENLIKAHQQAQQKQAEAKAYLVDLREREKGVKGKLSEITGAIRVAERGVSKALTSSELEQAIVRVEEARQQEHVTSNLLKNLGRAINDTTNSLSGLSNDISLAEIDIWGAQRDRLIEEVKTHADVLRLILKAYVAFWKSGYGWTLDTFIREKIMNVGVHIDPEVLAQLIDEMSGEIWPSAQVLQPSQEWDEKDANVPAAAQVD